MEDTIYGEVRGEIFDDNANIWKVRCIIDSSVFLSRTIGYIDFVGPDGTVIEIPLVSVLNQAIKTINAIVTKENQIEL